MNDMAHTRAARRLSGIQLSPTFEFEVRAQTLRAAGHDIVVLGAGEPDFPTPAPIVEAALIAARDGMTRYTPMTGMLALREAICRKLENDHGLRYTPDAVIASTGAKQSLFNLMHALLDQGDEVLLPTPCWVSYGDIATMAGGVPVTIPTRFEDGYLLSPSALESAITPATRLLILNSPGNPTGSRYRMADWKALGKVLSSHPHVMIACDDIYEKILLDDEPFEHFLQACPELAHRTVIVNGVSKSYAMTGWRLGYAAGPADIVKAMELVQSQATSCPSSVSQAAALAALESGDEFSAPMRAAFKARHANAFSALSDVPGQRCRPARGAFYLLPDFSSAIEELHRRGLIPRPDDRALAEWLLEEHGVGLVPGSAFHAPGCLRLSFAAGPKVIDTAFSRLRRAFKDLA